MTQTPSWKLKMCRIWRNISEFFVCDIWDPIKTGFYNVKWFFHNIKVFWKTLWEFRDWDYQYQIDMFIVGLVELRNRIDRGNEDERSAKKKVAKIDELIKELKRDIDDEVDALAIEGKVSSNDGSWKAEYDLRKKQRLENVFNLIAGQDDVLFDAKYRLAVDIWKEAHGGKEPNSNETYDIWVELFDGSGMDGWWE